MDQAKRELVQAWLIKARNDLETAHQIGMFPEGHLDIAIYHCQQAAEKVIKAFLSFHDHELERTHDLRHLIQIATRYDNGFSNWMDVAIILTPYATAYRYPGEAATLEPSRAEFDEALDSGTKLVNFVHSLLPTDILPPS
jgi:HEPN domain-containing protein